jgi:hypothetical protein
VWFEVTSAKVDDVVAGRAIPVEPGATYVFDKGYTDYRCWSELVAAGAFFVTRRKRIAHRRPSKPAALLPLPVKPNVFQIPDSNGPAQG